MGPIASSTGRITEESAESTVKQRAIEVSLKDAVSSNTYRPFPLSLLRTNPPFDIRTK